MIRSRNGHTEFYTICETCLRKKWIPEGYAECVACDRRRDITEYVFTGVGAVLMGVLLVSSGFSVAAWLEAMGWLHTWMLLVSLALVMVANLTLYFGRFR